MSDVQNTEPVGPLVAADAKGRDQKPRAGEETVAQAIEPVSKVAARAS